ncbi:DUF2510 domain-containing protein [Streptomyces sp. NPDC058664]|uniref:DUF2510 domain-containing protein n=1 Tax=unclassified Streptomyces TaxID=2593676 RepID=UPI00365FCE29
MNNMPPGWYPDPGYAQINSGRERWWDGSAWSQFTRIVPQSSTNANMRNIQDPAQAEALQGRLGIVVAVVVAAGVLMVLVLLLVGNIKLTASPANSASRPLETGAPTSSTFAETPSPTPTPLPSRSVGNRWVIDKVDGIIIPVLDGWRGETVASGSGITTGAYPCPADTEQTCVQGGVVSAPASQVLKSGTAEEAAKEDISNNVKQSYAVDNYGIITSHREIHSRKIEVAGQSGYLVRWEIATASGTQAVVESLVFPSHMDPSQLILIRFALDIGPGAPGEDSIDIITKGIKKSSH